MNTLAFIVPAKSSASHAEDSHFNSPASKKPEETFDTLIKRALSQPKRERSDDSAAPKESPALAQRSATGKKIAMDHDDRRQEALEKSSPASNADSSAQTVNHKSSSSEDEDSTKSQPKPDEKENSKTEVTTPIMVALPVPPPTIVPPQTPPETASANGNSFAAITSPLAGEQTNAANASADSTPAQAVANEQVSAALAKLKPAEPDSTGKKASVSAEHPAKKTGQPEGGVTVDKLLAKAEAVEEKPLNPMDLADSKAQSKPHELSGISTAQQAATMKNADTAEKISEQVEQTLPTDPGVKAVARAASADKPAAPAAAKALDAVTSTHSTNLDRPAAPPTADNMISASGQTELRLRALDRTHDIVALHAMRMKDSNTDSLHVVIKPGAGVQLSLDLKQTASGIEAQAILNRGDFQQLNQHWSELQQRLEERGIKLAPLNGNENSTASSGENFSKQNQHANGEPLASGAFAEFALAGAVADKAAQRAARATSHRGWESWA